LWRPLPLLLSVCCNTCRVSIFISLSYVDFTRVPAIACLLAVVNIPNVAGILAVAEASNADVSSIVGCSSVLNIPVVASDPAIASVSALASVPAVSDVPAVAGVPTIACILTAGVLSVAPLDFREIRELYFLLHS
jgi:hypothetical protein